MRNCTILFSILALISASAFAAINDSPKDASLLPQSFTQGFSLAAGKSVGDFTKAPGVILTFQTDGNLVVKDAHQNELWASNTKADCLTKCVLQFQTDGNLVLYSNGKPYWASHTERTAASNFVLRNQSPYLQISDATGKPIWPISPPVPAGHPAPIPTKTNISYGPSPHQLMDFYIPSDGVGPFPVVIWYGLIWVPGKNTPPGLGRLYAAHIASVSVETRTTTDAIADKVSPPISYDLLDARRALQYVRLHATEWNLDPNRIAVAGSSQAAIPALYVATEGERANPQSSDPIERVSTKVVSAVSFRGPGSIDPKRLLEWNPGDTWGAPCLGYSFDESLKRRDELLPLINQWSPDALLTRNAPPIYIEYDWGLIKPENISEVSYRIHSPLLALGFQKLAQERGATVYVKFPDHDSEKYKDTWDFIIQTLNASDRQ